MFPVVLTARKVCESLVFSRRHFFFNPDLGGAAGMVEAVEWGGMARRQKRVGKHGCSQVNTAHTELWARVSVCASKLFIGSNMRFGESV